MVERMGWVGGRRGGRVGTNVVGGVLCEVDVGVFSFRGSVGVLLREFLLMSIGGGAGCGGSTRAPAHASRRWIYVRNPSFHFISSSSISCRLRFRESIGWARSSGLSKR